MIDNMDNSSRMSIMLYDHDHHLPHHHHHYDHHMTAVTDTTRCSSDESKQQSVMIDSELLSLLLDSDFLNDDRDDDDGSNNNNNNSSNNSGPPSYTTTCCPSMSQERMIIHSFPTGSLMGSMTMPISTTHQYQYQSGLDSLHSSCSTSDSLPDLSLTTLDICSDDADPHEDIDFIGCFIDADYNSCYEGEEEEYRGGGGGGGDDTNEFSIISSTSGTSISSSRGGPCPCSPSSMKKRGRPKKTGGGGGGRRGGSGSTHQLTHKEYIARLQHQEGEGGPHLSTTTTSTTVVLDAHPPHHHSQMMTTTMLRRVDSDHSSEGHPFSPTTTTSLSSSSSSSSTTEVNPIVDYSCLYDDVDTYFGVHDSYQPHHASFNYDVVEQHHHHHQQRSMMIPACVYNMTMSSNMDPITATTTAASTIASAVRTFSDKINGPFLNGIPPSSLFFTPEDQFSEFNLPFEFLGDNFD